MKNLIILFAFLLNPYTSVFGQCVNSISAGNGHSLMVKEDGTLWAWGYNYYGQLGVSPLPNHYEPFQIGNENDWEKVSAGGNHSLGIKNNGSLWAWGYNIRGQVGDSTIVDKHFPVQINNDSEWIEISAGFAHSCAINTDGMLWCWGMNEDGQLGDGTFIDKLQPVPIEPSTSWKKISCGHHHTLAIKTDGTVWAWGNNEYGQIGNGTTSPVWGINIPQQIGATLGWEEVSAGYDHSMAIDANNSLWGWGENFGGQLGDGTELAQLTPKFIGSNWEQIAASNYHTHGIKTDNSLWSWGLNGDGVLGIGNYVQKLSPTKVGNVDEWAHVSSRNNHSLALKSDGLMWAWGSNDYGQVGNGLIWQDQLTPISLTCPGFVSSTLENGKTEISIFPIPSYDFIQYEINENMQNDEITIKIINSFGQIVLNKKIQLYKDKIDIREIPSGIYYLKFESKNWHVLRKIIKL